MRLDRLNGNILADMARNLITLLEGSELSAIDENVRAGLIAMIGTKPAELSAQTAAAEAIDNEKQAAYSARDMTHSEVAEWVRRVRDLLRAVRADDTQLDLAGFITPTRRKNAYTAADPTDVAAVGFSNGINEVRYVGNNRHGLVVYEIWRRTGREGEWQKHDLTRKQRYLDRGVIPGQYYEYRVRAVAAQNVSGFSNTTVVYGVL